eukprot:6198097-Pleurochrysis_carterae.AAC.1
MRSRAHVKALGPAQRNSCSRAVRHKLIERDRSGGGGCGRDLREADEGTAKRREREGGDEEGGEKGEREKGWRLTSGTSCT